MRPLFFVVDVELVMVVMVVLVVVVTVVWMHKNVINHSYSFSIIRNRQNFKLWRIKRMLFIRTDRRTDGQTNPHIEMLGRI